MLKGIGASQGFGIGKAVVIRDTNLDYSSVKFTDSDHQKKASALGSRRLFRRNKITCVGA